MSRIAIPNKKVSFVYDEIVEEWFSDNLGLAYYDQFVGSLVNGRMEEFKNYLAGYLMQAGSYFDFDKSDAERVFHVFVLGLVVGLKDEYVIESNREVGLGRVDVIMIPKDKKRKGIIMEFKVSKDAEGILVQAEEGLKQIKERRYMEVFKGHGVGVVLAVGLGFFGKLVELVWEEVKVG